MLDLGRDHGGFWSDILATDGSRSEKYIKRRFLYIAEFVEILLQCQSRLHIS